MTQPIPDLDSERKLRGLLAYTRKGWHIFPLHSITATAACSCSNGPNCGNPGKHPLTPKGFKNATTDEKQIREWHKRWPQANWAISCGHSKLAVVDVDPRNQGDESLATLESQHGRLPQTVRALTGGGGTHEIFAWPADTEIPSGILAGGIELKAKGGYIVVAPSNHISGRVYEWDAGGHPNDTDPVTLPQWIQDRLRSPDTKQYESAGRVTEGFIGKCFEIMGWLGRGLGPDKQSAQCPWETEHSSGARHNSSTVVFSPQRGHRTGWFWCSHSHCQRNRTLAAVLSAIPTEVQAKAREALGFDPQFDPLREEQEKQQSRSFGDDVDPRKNQWAQALRFTQENKLTKDAGNVALILANHDDWRGTLEYDVFSDRIRWVRPVPEIQGMSAPKPGEDLSDHHVTYVHHWFAKLRGVSFPKTAIQDALEAAAKVSAINPVRTYLDGLEWDQVPRIAKWLERYLGADPTPYTSIVGTWWLISAVARIYDPGCQADHLVVLEGGQGAGKSTAARILGGDWFLANLPDITNKDAPQLLQGHWIAEIGELDAFKGAAGTRVKDWVTRTVDSYRPAYGRFSVRRPRSCVFIGTTNEHQYLTDATGARRFWPVQVNTLERDALIRDRDQLWAEAKHHYQCGEQWWPSAEHAALIGDQQEERFAGDEWQKRISDWIGDRNGFTAGEVLAGALNIEPGKWDRQSQTRVGICLRRLGFQSKQEWDNATETRVRRYRRAS